MGEYLGGGVYVEWDGFGLLLTTSDGIRVTNEIYLEIPVMESLKRYYEGLFADE